MNKKINHSKIIISIKKNINFTNEELARYLGISERNIHYWIHTKNFVIPQKYWPLLIKLDKNLTGSDLHGCNIDEEEVNEDGKEVYDIDQ